MKIKILCVFLFLFLYGTANSQSLSLFDVDTSAFPTIRAKFLAIDVNGKQIRNLSLSDFTLTENGTPRNVTYVSCPPPPPPIALSSVLVMDVSGSMYGKGLSLAKTAALAWINGLPTPNSECAITAFDDGNYFVQDFTTNRQLLVQKADALFTGGGTDYNQAFTEPIAGGLLITKSAKHKKVLIMLTDGVPNHEPNVSRVVEEANLQGVSIYAVTLGFSCPQSLKNISTQTGGNWFENVSTNDEAQSVYQEILMIAQRGDPCTIEWQSTVSCVPGIINAELGITSLDLKAYAKYQIPNTAVAKLEFNPTTIRFDNPTPGVAAPPQKVIVTARNSDFSVSNISTKIPVGFDINPMSFSLKSGESIELTVTYFPADSGFNYCKFDVESQPCPTKFYVSGGWRGKKPSIRTLILIHPNGGEIFVAGSDKEITWEGVSPDNPVLIKYSINNGNNWDTIASNATGLSYKWRVPQTPSDQCLVSVTAKASFYEVYEEILICNQIWMVKNLDVDTYRNGDPIPEVTYSTNWANLKTGAWCYAGYFYQYEKIYGKLYNWYAVNDPRGLAPEGWHIPTDEEWTELENCLISSGYNYDGTTTGNKIAKALARAGLWVSSSKEGTVGNSDYPAKINATGFSAIPAGTRYYSGSFYGRDYVTAWWSATEYIDSNAWYRSLNSDEIYLKRSDSNKPAGFSVRCVKD